MLLTIDIGNTNTVAGLFEGESLRSRVRLVSDHENTQANLIAPLWDWYRALNPDSFELFEVAIASVVPSLSQEFLRFFRSNLGILPLFINSNVRLPLKLEFDDPSAVGADRIANAVAARENHLIPGQPLVVVDFGTATTFDILNSDGDYIGGIICPGPRTAVSNLSVQAEQLFDVEIEAPTDGRVIAKNTEDAIKSGMFFGTIGEIKFLIEKIGAELGMAPKTVATGGLATVINGQTGLFESVDPDLTLSGIRLIHSFQ